jgi:DNA-binding transcriptional regulator YiaG
MPLFCGVSRNTYPRSLPFCYFTLRVTSERLKMFILRRKGLVEGPSALGEHLRNRRLSMGLTQPQAATWLGVLREVYERWERDERQPVVSAWPSLLAFLGYYPDQPDTGTADLVLMARRVTGLDQKALAQRLGVIHQRLRRWERGNAQPSSEERQRLKVIAGTGTPHLQVGWPANASRTASRRHAG